MTTVDKQIKNFEPLMHKILHRFRITKCYYKDYLQELRIVAWQILKKYDETKGALSTIMQIAMQNRLKDLLRKIDNNIVYLEDLGFSEKNKALGDDSNTIKKIDLGIMKNKLSANEKKIVELFLRGQTQDEIREELNINQSTVQRKLQGIFTKIRKLIKLGGVK